MARKIRRMKQYDAERDYPSLSEHSASRRRFLLGGAAVIGGSAIAGCVRPFWKENEVAGGISMPNYHDCRFPQNADDQAVYLMDGGYARFYVTAITYDWDAASMADIENGRLTDLIADELAGHSYDYLLTASGVAAVTNQIQALLDAEYAEDIGSTDTGWFVEVVLNITHIEASEDMGGVPPAAPEYP